MNSRDSHVDFFFFVCGAIYLCRFHTLSLRINRLEEKGTVVLSPVVASVGCGHSFVILLDHIKITD